MRILSVSHFFEAHGGGIERVAGHLCRHFARLGAKPVWAASDADQDPASEIDVVPLRCVNPTERLTGLPMPVPGFGAIRRLRRAVQSCDAVVIHDALYVTSILAMMMAKALGKRVILIQHIAGIPFSSRLLRATLSAANFAVVGPMLRAADQTVFISNSVRKEFLNDLKGHSSELVFNGVDGSIFHPGHGDGGGRRTALDVTGYRCRVLFVGRYVAKKGLRVLRALAEMRPDTAFFLAGGGPVRPTDWGLANIYDLGPQTQEGLAELYRSADLLILPSVGEGFPLVIQEAMACGLPVVCGTPSDSADPDAKRWLKGVDIDLNNPAASAQRCSDAMDDFVMSSADRAKMAQYARQRYDWDTIARRLLDLASGLEPSDSGR